MALLDSPLVGEPSAGVSAPRAAESVLVLGVGNVLMGDEGVGVHVLRALEQAPRPAGVRLLDGGTGGVNLLAEFEGVGVVLLIDATYDGQAAGTVTHLRPQRIADLPRGLGAHDFGVKDLFAAAALLDLWPELHVFTVSIAEMRPMCTELSAPVARAVPHAVREILASLARFAPHGVCPSGKS